MIIDGSEWRIVRIVYVDLHSDIIFIITLIACLYERNDEENLCSNLIY